jgi:hypothetical protein
LAALRISTAPIKHNLDGPGSSKVHRLFVQPNDRRGNL